MSAVTSIPPALLWATVSFLIYAVAKPLYSRLRFPLFHPVMLTGAVLIATLHLTGTDYETYMTGGRLISFFLGPSVVALGVPLYLRMREMKRSAPMILSVVVFGSAVGVVSAVVPALLMGAPDVVVRALAPKSVTTPIAIAVAVGIGGDASLTTAFVVLTGIFGAVLGPLILRLLGITHPVAFGLAMGCAAHGIGTARSLEEGQLHGAAAGLGICLCGIMTAILTPFLVGMIVG